MMRARTKRQVECDVPRTKGSQNSAFPRKHVGPPVAEIVILSSMEIPPSDLSGYSDGLGIVHTLGGYRPGSSGTSLRISVLRNERQSRIFLGSDRRRVRHRPSASRRLPGTGVVIPGFHCMAAGSIRCRSWPCRVARERDHSGGHSSSTAYGPLAKIMSAIVSSLGSFMWGRLRHWRVWNTDRRESRPKRTP